MIETEPKKATLDTIASELWQIKIAIEEQNKNRKRAGVCLMLSGGAVGSMMVLSVASLGAVDNGVGYILCASAFVFAYGFAKTL